MNYDPMYIPARDLKILSDAGARQIDLLMWAYRLGRQQGMLEGSEAALKKLKEAA